MSPAFDYTAAPYPMRPDLAEAHRAAWRDIARPGRWWSGAERVAIAEQSRRARECALCAERKAALSPFSVDGSHGREDGLPEPAVDAVHRIVTDPARLTQSWVEKLAASGLPAGPYVELLGVVVAIVSIDELHAALDLPLEPLPRPEPGEPTRQHPEGAVLDVAWVPMLQPGKLAASEADLFGGSRGANVIRAMSLVPEAVRLLIRLSDAHYVAMHTVGNPGAPTGRALDRSQIELIAGRVSALNECFY